MAVNLEQLKTLIKTDPRYRAEDGGDRTPQAQEYDERYIERCAKIWLDETFSHAKLLDNDVMQIIRDRFFLEEQRSRSPAPLQMDILNTSYCGPVTNTPGTAERDYNGSYTE